MTTDVTDPSAKQAVATFTASVTAAPEAAKRWIGFLRKYGPIPTNDNMYDEVIRRAMRRTNTAPITLPTAYLEAILENFRGDAPESVILTGTAGDGKTYHCRCVWSAFGGSEEQWNAGAPVQKIAIPAGELTIVKDLTELSEREGAELIRQMAEDLHVGGTGRFYLVAANHGQLMDKWKTATGTLSVHAIGRIVEDLLVTGESRSASVKLALHNLSSQSGADMLRRVLDQVLEHPAWDHCAGCPIRAEAGCPIWENRTRLRGDADEGLLRRRLEALAELSEQNGVHFPIRHLLLLAANMLLGHPEAKEHLLTCDDVPSIVATNRAHLASIYRNVFGENLPSRRREATDVFEKLSRFGIGHETSNRIDGMLVYGADDPNLRSKYKELVESDSLYGGTASWHRVQQTYLEEGTAAGSADGFLEALRAQRQRLFFTLPDAMAPELAPWELTVFRSAGTYLELVRRVAAGQPAPRSALPILVRGLNRIMTGMLVQNPTELVLATSGSHSQSRISQLLDSTISVPRKLGEEVAFVRDRNHVAISVKFVREGEPPPVLLRLTLLRFEFLCRVAEGSLPSSFSLECYEDLLAFKTGLLRSIERRRQLDGLGDEQSGEIVLQFIDLTEDGRALPQRVEVRGS